MFLGFWEVLFPYLKHGSCVFSCVNTVCYTHPLDYWRLTDIFPGPSFVKRKRCCISLWTLSCPPAPRAGRREQTVGQSCLRPRPVLSSAPSTVPDTAAPSESTEITLWRVTASATAHSWLLSTPTLSFWPVTHSSDFLQCLYLKNTNQLVFTDTRAYLQM